jgi:hypothetical protein
MPLNASQVNIEEQKQKGRDAAIAANATEPKELRDGLEEEYPYTYWWWVGYNEAIE